MSDGFSIEVEALRHGAKRFLGAAIDDLLAAKLAFDAVKGHDHAFEGGDDLFAEIQIRWEEMRHYFDRVFTDNIENLTLSREALLEIADRYERADDESARSLRT